MSKKPFVYFFGQGESIGHASMKNLLGGKGANLAEMCRMGIPVPPGFTISTEACNYYYNNNLSLPPGLTIEAGKALSKVEAIMNAKFGNKTSPLLVSIRSGARQSMPGMMDTVLNVGLTEKTIPGLIEATHNTRFVYDAYRRLIAMYADVVMEKAKDIPTPKRGGIHQKLERILDAYKNKYGFKSDIDLGGDDLKHISNLYKNCVLENLGSEFPDDPHEQLWGAIKAVFQSWNGKRAVSYRQIEKIPHDWGTAVNVQAMVYGNKGELSATGVAFTRNPATGENKFYGEWLPNAQGEDVVAGIRTPQPLNEATRTIESSGVESLERFLPEQYIQLSEIRVKLENHFKNMQDIEFTIENGVLWMLQTRDGKRTGMAAIRMAVDMVSERLINKKEAILRVDPQQIDELLHPALDPEEEKNKTEIARGLPAGPGGGVGRIVFTADDAEEWAKNGENVILV